MAITLECQDCELLDFCGSSQKDKRCCRKWRVFMSDSGEKQNILFLCTGNTFLSQMAKGWAKSSVIKAYPAAVWV